MIEFETPEGHRFALSKGAIIELSEDKINNNVRVHTVIDGANDFWHIAGTYDEAKAKIEAFERGGVAHGNMVWTLCNHCEKCISYNNDDDTEPCLSCKKTIPTNFEGGND